MVEAEDSGTAPALAELMDVISVRLTQPTPRCHAEKQINQILARWDKQSEVNRGGTEPGKEQAARLLGGQRDI